MHFAVLGSLEVSADRGPLSLGGGKQRMLLAMLLVARNSVVARDQLIDALWSSRPPPSAHESLDTYVYRLRKLLGQDRLLREPGGYCLRVEPGELDADRFEHLVEQASYCTAAEDAIAALTEALSLWRGTAWIDALDCPGVAPHAQRLEELRLEVLEAQIEARLELGEGGSLAPEIELLVQEHPFRERLVASLMLALYRGGRQTEALDTYQLARRRLIDELGLEPSPELRELEQRILEHDPTLGSRSRRLPSSVERHRTRVALLLIPLIVLIAAVLVAATAGRHRGLALAAGANGVVALAPNADSVDQVAALPGPPGALTISHGSLWIADPGAEQVIVVDPSSGAVTDRIPLASEPGAIATGDGAIWAITTVGSTVTRIDPLTESVTQTIALAGANADAIVAGLGRIWVADGVDRKLFELDPRTDRLIRTITLHLEPSALAVGDGSLWVAGYNDETVERLDPMNAHVIGRVRVGNGPSALAVGSGSVWVANTLDSTVSRINPSSLRVSATVAVGSGPVAMVATRSAVWISNQYSGSVSRIDPEDNSVISTVAVGGAPSSLILDRGRPWVGVSADSGHHRGGTLVIVTPGRLTSAGDSIQSADPAYYTSANNPQFTGLAYDELVGYQQSAGAGGLRLVPDLAISIPTPADGGRTYAFRIRSGIRYSDGQTLRASDFRRGVERLFRLRSQGAYFYYGLVGAGACRRQPRTCDLARGITTDNAGGAVVYHFSRPDPEFLYQLTEYGFSAPVPPGTPDHETGSHTVPGTGPYRIAQVSPNEIRFVRNPFFREWSNAAQPAGNPNVIVWKSAPSIQAGVAEVKHGRGDWFFGQPPYSEVNSLRLQDPAQLHINPQFAVAFVPLNTNVPPFNDPRVRRALNYGINRSTLVQLYGGPEFATPTCQVIVPGIPGYRRYCPYTLRPSRSGAWGAPDLARARRLVHESGTAGELVDVTGAKDTGWTPPGVTGYIAGVLRSLGYRVRVRVLPIATITQTMYDHLQIITDGNWIPDYPDPSAYVPSFFACGGAESNDYYCNPAIDREMTRAELLEPTDPAASSATWEMIDRQLTNGAEWVSTVDTREVEITSPRLRNYEYNPVMGFLADQAWLPPREPRTTSPRHSS
jgi:YVTN family beta-propeller protein